MASSDIRSKLLKYNPFRSKEVEVEILNDDGSTETLKVKVKQPSVEERHLVFSDTKVKNGEISIASEARTRALLVIHLCRHVDTDEPIFTGEDLDVLMHMPSGGWVDTLAMKCMELLVDAQDLAKK